MVRSMTGFASTTMILTLPDGSSSNVTLHLKSLNSRYFEASCRFPYPLSTLETEVVRLFKETLLRGKITCTLYISNPTVFTGKVEPVIPLIKQYLKATETIKQSSTISGELTVATLFTLPHVFNIEEQSLDESSKQQVVQAIHQLIEQLITMQQTEGKNIQKDLLKRVALMQKDIDQINTASTRLVEEQKQKVHQTLAELEDDESKFAELKKNALYAILDKIDIHEEVVRFKSHLGTIADQLNSATVEKGKRLDFTLQELHREVNTIAAKGSDAQISSLAINIKVELEKAREQAQNIV